MKKFFCDQCGLCCKNLNKSAFYSELDRGDGVCMYFDEQTNLCLIYSNRPLKCRVDDMFQTVYKQHMSLEDFYQLNYEACNQLKKEER